MWAVELGPILAAALVLAASKRCEGGLHVEAHEDEQHRSPGVHEHARAQRRWCVRMGGRTAESRTLARRERVKSEARLAGALMSRARSAPPV